MLKQQEKKDELSLILVERTGRKKSGGQHTIPSH